MPQLTPSDLSARLTGRLGKVWHLAAVGAPYAWDTRITLGAPTATQAAGDLARFGRWSTDWVTFGQRHDVLVEVRDRQVARTPQRFAFAVMVADAFVAARLVGGAWADRMTAGARRGSLLTGALPATAGTDLGLLARAVRATDGWSDLNLQMLVRAAGFFAEHDATGLTPRQVPIEGMHAKWMNTHHQLVADLAGRDTLGLAPGHPSRIHFTYLDPEHLAGGGRRHDSYSVGDTFTPPYQVQVVVICENKDTVVGFPPVRGGVAVEGAGSGATAFAATPWIVASPRVIYWGDMDADGLRILSQFRAARVARTSMLMDEPTYEVWEKYGTNLDKFGRPLAASPENPDLALTDAERALYRRLTSTDLTSHRRVEQERIPLPVALDALNRLLDM
ncbi:DUF2220 family protein [Cellulosimicrobium sp. XJ-DQ-B-000]|uniref:Wadjet anti-phage system protein JetD domain-containing protein n=1 Tax=Cellulosimicrobium sp. XJ-DQ-B-000 TaxID=3072182 RepID=UPI002807B073|nr:Wadjet anti-phage system protein JetD domain-containing protein [Cellulosimicrobium sp. XJ-DQ-B-000]MDQ8041955.1 DUF2220 family protein [Cellulosimicrobium sp. XJ-DQ-B-000]